MDFTLMIALTALLGVFYFFTIRPENKRKKQLAEMRDSIATGDEVTTVGGIIGKVVHTSDDTVTFETGEDRVRIKVAKWAISNKGTATSAPPAEK